MPLSREEIIERLAAAFKSASNGRVDPSELREEMLITIDLGLYSLELLDLRFELEEMWGIRITDQEAIRLRTVADVVDLVQRSQKQ